MNPSRSERRVRQAVERKATQQQGKRRRTGDWLPWERREIAAGEVGKSAWLKTIHTAHRNGAYAVLVRTIDTAWGPVEHAMISTLAGGDIPWADKQRIKSEIFGAHRTAIEVFPAEADLIDGADAYHLWVLPDGFALPFTLAPEKS